MATRTNFHQNHHPPQTAWCDVVTTGEYGTKAPHRWESVTTIQRAARHWNDCFSPYRGPRLVHDIQHPHRQTQTQGSHSYGHQWVGIGSRVRRRAPGRLRSPGSAFSRRGHAHVQRTTDRDGTVHSATGEEAIEQLGSVGNTYSLTYTQVDADNDTGA